MNWTLLIVCLMPTWYVKKTVTLLVSILTQVAVFINKGEKNSHSILKSKNSKS